MDRPNGIWSVDEFCDILRKDPNYHGGDIRLISCETGAKDAVAAQGVANRLGVNVIAPSDVVWISPDGKFSIGETEFDNSGTWVVFKPQKGEKP